MTWLGHEPMSGFCPSCGTPRKSGAEFCTKCGVKLPGMVAGAVRSTARIGRATLVTGVAGLAVLGLAVLGATALTLSLLSARPSPTPAPTSDLSALPSVGPTAVPATTAPTGTPASSEPSPTPTPSPTEAATPAPTPSPTLTPEPTQTPTTSPASSLAPQAGVWEVFYELISVDGKPSSSYVPQPQHRIWRVRIDCGDPYSCPMRVHSFDADTTEDHGTFPLRWDGEAFVRRFSPSVAETCTTTAGIISHAYNATEIIRLYPGSTDESGVTLLTGEDTLTAVATTDEIGCGSFVVHFQASAQYIGPDS